MIRDYFGVTYKISPTAFTKVEPFVSDQEEVRQRE
jgi:hypothetical protein